VFRCIICKKSKYTTISKNTRDSNHKILKCETCNHVQIFPTMSKKETREFYDQDKQLRAIIDKINFKEMEDKTKLDIRNRYSLISKYINKKSKILEIGSGYGFFLKFLKNKGCNIEGVEISEIRRNYSKKKVNCKIHNINFNENHIHEIGEFDIITMFQVLEHISEPIQFLKNIKSIMKENGKLIIEVPNLSDIQIKNNLEYKKWFWQVAHVSYYNPQTLKNVLKKVGFVNVEINGLQRYGLENMFHWKILKKPQLKHPSKKIEKDFEWLEKYYKSELEKRRISDTITCIASKNQ